MSPCWILMKTDPVETMKGLKDLLDGIMFLVQNPGWAVAILSAFLIIGFIVSVSSKQKDEAGTNPGENAAKPEATVIKETNSFDRGADSPVEGGQSLLARMTRTELEAAFDAKLGGSAATVVSGAGTPTKSSSSVESQRLDKAMVLLRKSGVDMRPDQVKTLLDGTESERHALASGLAQAYPLDVRPGFDARIARKVIADATFERLEQAREVLMK